VTAFTIMLPTTADRGCTLEQVLPLVCLQSVRDWELFVIGDGVDVDTRAVLHAWCQRDPRIRFFDHPKHERRGETYRHAALQQARGRCVAYLTDRDLWLHDHLASLNGLLQHHAFAHTERIDITPAGRPRTSMRCDLGNPAQRRAIERFGSMPIGLSTVGHTLEAYRRLPWGWRTTPKDRKTDHYMWHQFLREGGASACSGRTATVLYFNRGDHPGWPSAQRAAELARWRLMLANVEAQERWRQTAASGLDAPWARLQSAWRSWLFFHRGIRDPYLRWRRRLKAWRS